MQQLKLELFAVRLIFPFKCLSKELVFFIVLKYFLREKKRASFFTSIFTKVLPDADERGRPQLHYFGITWLESVGQFELQKYETDKTNSMPGSAPKTLMKRVGQQCTSVPPTQETKPMAMTYCKSKLFVIEI